LCEEETTSVTGHGHELSGVSPGWASAFFLGRAKILAFKEAKKMWVYIMKMVHPPVTE